MLLNDNKFIPTISGQEAVFCQDSGQACCKYPDKTVPLIMTEGVINILQAIHVKHHNPHIQSIIQFLDLVQLLFQCFFIMDPYRICCFALHHILYIIFQGQRQGTSK